MVSCRPGSSSKWSVETSLASIVTTEDQKSRVTTPKPAAALLCTVKRLFLDRVCGAHFVLSSRAMCRVVLTCSFFVGSSADQASLNRLLSHQCIWWRFKLVIQLFRSHKAHFLQSLLCTLKLCICLFFCTIQKTTLVPKIRAENVAIKVLFGFSKFWVYKSAKHHWTGHSGVFPRASEVAATGTIHVCKTRALR